MAVSSSAGRSEEHTSELQSRVDISYAVFCLKKIEIDAGKSKDPAPFNSGLLAEIRISNTNHKATLPLSERSAGFVWFFFFNDPATPEIYTLSLPVALPISPRRRRRGSPRPGRWSGRPTGGATPAP